MVVVGVVVEVAVVEEVAVVVVAAMISPAVADTRVSSALVMRRASVSPPKSYQTFLIKPSSAWV